ncbi:MAG: hypothetical protein EOP88_21140 [Verrucomicrobiaceae bacterium]|nr:MAG: hypothetical protein EOP88_21140 [Verrucomicrobiaceae bacterium]
MSTEPVNCGRCAHLANREPNQIGSGRCGCTARMQETGQIRPLVNLTYTCEWAQLSAKYDPEFLKRVRAERYPHIVSIPSILSPLTTSTDEPDTTA